MGSRTRKIFRPITKTIFYFLVLISVVASFLVLLKPDEFNEFYDDFNREFETVPPLADFGYTIYFGLILLIFIMEALNLLTINHKDGILDQDEVDEYLSAEEINRDKTLIMIPALNEEATISKAIEVGQKVGQVLVIDDGSTDNTKNIAKERAEHVISHSRNHGLASGISNGIDYALKHGFETMVIFDADLQYTEYDLRNVTTLLQNSPYDLVMGSRLSGTIEKMNPLKRFGNWIFSKALSYMTDVPISDGQTGLRAFSSTFAGNIKFRGQFTYTQEMLFEASKYDFRLAEIPIDFKKRQAGESRLMASAIDYAVRAWTLNLQILAEYNPLRFTLSLMAILLSLSFLTVSPLVFSERTVTIILLFTGFIILFSIGIFSSIMINRLDRLSEGINYRVVKDASVSN